MFGQWSYLAMIVFVAVGSGWLEWAFQLRVLRKPTRAILTILTVSPWFLIWDAYAIAQGHWFFDRNLITGIYGPMDIPLEEYLFFIVVPLAAILTLEGSTAALKLLKNFHLTRERVLK
ncbi:MAG: hypothetical protein RJB32_291 [Actinomycetota bacterium]|jgi:lycopene cyclase domain-containing protein